MSIATYKKFKSKNGVQEDIRGENMGLNKGYLTAGRTAESDECLTPRYVIKPIIKYLQAKRI
jgi:hypothetical protein